MLHLQAGLPLSLSHTLDTATTERILREPSYAPQCVRIYMGGRPMQVHIFKRQITQKQREDWGFVMPCHSREKF